MGLGVRNRVRIKVSVCVWFWVFNFFSQYYPTLLLRAVLQLCV